MDCAPEPIQLTVGLHVFPVYSGNPDGQAVVLGLPGAGLGFTCRRGRATPQSRSRPAWSPRPAPGPSTTGRFRGTIRPADPAATALRRAPVDRPDRPGRGTRRAFPAAEPGHGRRAFDCFPGKPGVSEHRGGQHEREPDRHLTNDGNVTLDISTLTSSVIALSSGFALAVTTCRKDAVPAGATCSLSVAFAPTSVGGVTGTLTITDPASSTPQIVNLSGTASAPVTLSASSLTFCHSGGGNHQHRANCNPHR